MEISWNRQTKSKRAEARSKPKNLNKDNSPDNRNEKSTKGRLGTKAQWVTWQTGTGKGEHADLKHKWGGRLTRNS